MPMVLDLETGAELPPENMRGWTAAINRRQIVVSAAGAVLFALTPDIARGTRQHDRARDEASWRVFQPKLVAHLPG
jgi:hypothetical protein